MEDFEMFEESQMLEQNIDINFMLESSREQNTQNSDNHFISETSRVSCGKAFTIIKDKTLCRSWLAVSQDPITGNSQTMAIFWERVLVYFNSQLSSESNRNRISLSHRWSVMQKAINKFCDFLEQIQLKQQSETTETDMVTEAKRIYHAIQKKHFTFDTCWDILRRSCKWDEFRSKRSTQHADPCSNLATEFEASQSNQNNAVHEQRPNTSTRPIGTKAAKEKLKNQTTHDSRFDEMAANQSKIVEVLSTISARTIERDEQKAIDREQKAAERRRRAEDREEQLKLLYMMNEREQRNEDHKIMSMNMTILNPIQRAYYEDL
ncbi:glutathione S-transferase T3-like [Camellia sinensis]|uniref:glutathione S-transferase T3-like n=1 Tax=Camellia sinensis TaxID=4442 RepID=UPI001036AA4A|nr:glutathione S-transferase T3-like [Camellia sinensis]